METASNSLLSHRRQKSEVPVVDFKDIDMVTPIINTFVKDLTVREAIWVLSMIGNWGKRDTRRTVGTVNITPIKILSYPIFNVVDNLVYGVYFITSETCCLSKHLDEALIHKMYPRAKHLLYTTQDAHPS